MNTEKEQNDVQKHTPTLAVERNCFQLLHLAGAQPVYGLCGIGTGNGGGTGTGCDKIAVINIEQRPFGVCLGIDAEAHQSRQATRAEPPLLN